MNAFILAAGLGTRLKPWTLSHPKALVPVGGIPMLERVILNLREEGFDKIVINVHHFSAQILDFLSNKQWGVQIAVSDESKKLLDTGGGLLKASELFTDPDNPVLIHNVDILSDAHLKEIMRIHKESQNDISLITSTRNSTRRLVFDSCGCLKGWHNLSSGEFLPAGFSMAPDFHETAFSGIYIVEPKVFSSLRDFSTKISSDKFPIMDFFLSKTENINIGEIRLESLNLIDIGKPETLLEADKLFLK